MFKLLLLLPLFLLPTNCFLNFLVDESVTQTVNDRHIQAWLAKDIDAIIQDYSETSFIIINKKVFQGQDQFRSVFKQLFELFSHGNNQIEPAVIKAQTIYLIWRFTPDAFGSFSGSSTFIVEDGKIQVHTIASELYEMFPIN